MRTLKSERGTTLIETAIACAILLVVMVGLLSMAALATMLHREPRASRGAHDRVRAGQDGAAAGARLHRRGRPTPSCFRPRRPAAPGSRSAAARTPRHRSNGYVDWLAQDGSLLGGGTTPPADWFYERVWQIDLRPSGTSNRSPDRRQSRCATRSAGALIPKSTVVALKASQF